MCKVAIMTRSNNYITFASKTLKRDGLFEFCTHGTAVTYIRSESHVSVECVLLEVRATEENMH